MSWRSVLRTNFRDVAQLAQFLELEQLHAPKFPLNIPRRLAAKCKKGTLDDPILRQFVPLPEESELHPDFVLEPVHDSDFAEAGALIHKYQGRSLIVTTGVCAMHCRYCFRQNYDYDSKSTRFEEELKELQQADITEVILSGGDPLSLSTRELSELLQKIEQIPHIEVIRFHTRFPIGIPERVTPDLLALLARQKKQVIFVVHVNHARELDEEVLSALKNIQRLGIPVLNQSVLLRGVNDNVECLATLSRTLIANGIIPYYLHQLDRVQGAHHFEVPKQTGIQLIEQLRQQLPGYAVPSFVQEIPGMASKVAIV